MPKWKKPLRVGTDFSGIETPLMALKNMRVPYVHMFSSENDKAAQEVIRQRFRPKVLYADALKKPFTKLPKLDLYVAGFPCNMFSSARRGIPRVVLSKALQPFYSCYRTIVACKPKVFILENVPGLRTAYKGRAIAVIRRKLTQLAKYYHVSEMLLNAADYGSIQHRKRIFFVGLLRSCASQSLNAPPKTNKIKQKTIEDIVEQATKPEIPNVPRAKSNFAARIRKCTRRMNIPFFVHRQNRDPRQCATKILTLLQYENIYSSTLNRLLTLRELMRVQNIPDSFSFPQIIRSYQWKKNSIARAMDVKCIQALLSAALRRLVCQAK